MIQFNQQIEVAKLIGGLAAFVTSGGNAQDVNLGAEIAGSAIAFNRQLHRVEAELIKGNAAEYALLKNWCATLEECAQNNSVLLRAQGELTAQALKQVDSAFSGINDNIVAKDFLTNLRNNNTTAGLPEGQTLFFAEGVQYTHHLLNLEFIKEIQDVYTTLRQQGVSEYTAYTHALITAAKDPNLISQATEAQSASLLNSLGVQIKSLEERYKNIPGGVAVLNGAEHTLFGLVGALETATTIP